MYTYLANKADFNLKVGLMLQLWFKRLDGNHDMFPFGFPMERFFFWLSSSSSADDKLAFIYKHLFLAARGPNLFVMGDVQHPDGANVPALRFTFRLQGLLLLLH